MSRIPAAWLAVLGAAATAGAASGDARPPRLSEAEAREVSAAIAEMKRDPRGPYLRIRWYCADGSVHPPAGTPCRERGGGVQHAERSPLARRLDELGIHVGTVLQALDYAEFADSGADHDLLKQLVVQDYLVAVDDGWVLRRARYYRGARQIEDEERQGRLFLERLLADPAWIRHHFLLAMRVTGTVPHVGGGGAGETQRIRALASELAALDARYMDLRVKIHSVPSRDDLGAVESMHAAAPESPARARLAELRDALRRQYATDETAKRLAALAPRLPEGPRELLGEMVSALTRRDARRALERAGALSVGLRREASSSDDGTLNLLLLDVALMVQQQAFALAQEPEALGSGPRTRAERLTGLVPLLELATGSGLLSFREHDALRERIEALVGRESVTAIDYWSELNYLSRAIDWSVATGRMFFGPVLDRYVQVEPAAKGFLDDLVRGSPLLALTSELNPLVEDSNTALGLAHELMGETVSHGLRGLNPGVAQRPLSIATGAGEGDWDSGRIYVVPETIPEMRPAAGVLTLDAGNLLSHVQLLARGIGIPNAALSSGLLDRLQAWTGREVFFAVSPMGVVRLKDPARLSAAERRLVEQGRQVHGARLALDTSALRLDRDGPVPLGELRSSDAGVIVGPKAAELGQLLHEFPDRVAAGVALPFGLYVRHVERPFEGSSRTVREQIADAYGEAESMRAAGRSEDEVDAFMFSELARIRRAIQELDWVPELRAAVEQGMRDAFGGDLASGVFVRSDTNLEDLPQFSGAGLNLTVPHQRTEEAILDSIKRVWTSPFSERAYLWRKQVLEDRGEIYPSVLLLRSVPSDESGVLITSGLQLGGPEDMTIVTGEGVGAAVDGDDAETLLVTSDGRIRLLSQAKASYRKALADTGPGGIVWRPTSKRERLLTEDEVRQLRDVVARWQSVRRDGAARIWDVEFGFAGGRLWLFQARPFVRFRNSSLLEQLGALDAAVLEAGARRVALQEPL